MKRFESLRLVAKPAAFPLKTVLLVDGRDELRVFLKWFLSASNYVVDSVRNGEEALAIFQPVIHDMVVTSNTMSDTMSGLTGVELAHIIKLRSPGTRVVMYTDHLPLDDSCLDLVVEGSTHIPVLKAAMDRIVAQL